MLHRIQKEKEEKETAEEKEEKETVGSKTSRHKTTQMCTPTYQGSVLGVEFKPQCRVTGEITNKNFFDLRGLTNYLISPKRIQIIS